VLKWMKRHYDWEYIKKLLEKTKNIKRDDGIDVSLWADIIVGFPWETEEDFMETYNLIKDIWIQKLHAFPFSPHEMWESVPAWFFKDQVPEKIKKERIGKILFLWEQIRTGFIKSQMWKPLKVLIESVKNPHPLSGTSPLQEEEKQWKWWSQNYIECNNENFEIMEGEVKRNSIVFGKMKKAS
jgi:tRNA A37 methylthiotransferase MiaB